MAHLTIRFLDETETHLAQRLLFEVYCEFGGWLPLEGNPTDWRIERDSDGGLLLCDKFDGSALWVGCFDGDRLVGCHRINVREAGSGFDLEDYQHVPEFLLTARTAELTRLAVHPDYQKTHAMLSLLAFEFCHLKENGFQYFFTTAQFPDPGAMYCRMGMLPIEGPAFKFNEEEREECRLLYLEYGRAECEGPATRYVKLADRIAAKEKRAERAKAAAPPTCPVLPAASGAPGQSASSWQAQETCCAS